MNIMVKQDIMTDAAGNKIPSWFIPIIDVDKSLTYISVSLEAWDENRNPIAIVLRKDLTKDETKNTELLNEMWAEAWIRIWKAARGEKGE